MPSRSCSGALTGRIQWVWRSGPTRHHLNYIFIRRMISLKLKRHPLSLNRCGACGGGLVIIVVCTRTHISAPKAFGRNRGNVVEHCKPLTRHFSHHYIYQTVTTLSTLTAIALSRHEGKVGCTLASETIRSSRMLSRGGVSRQGH
jgi:hypothetical protein